MVNVVANIDLGIPWTHIDYRDNRYDKFSRTLIALVNMQLHNKLSI